MEAIRKPTDFGPKRNEIGFREWMKMDLAYIENWSFWRDIQLIFRTIKVVMLGEGRRTEDGGQTTEDRRRRTEGRGQTSDVGRTEDRGQTSEVGGRKERTEGKDKCQRSDVRSREETDVRSQRVKTEVRGRKTDGKR